MYVMKKIINHDEEIMLPKCMYRIKNPIESLKEDEININIHEQVTKLLKGPNKKMTELEHRQDELLKKLDILYDKIKTISSHCSATDLSTKATRKVATPILTPEEVVLVLSPDCLPWYLNIILKNSPIHVNVSWHIHSSVPNEKVPKIKAFIKHLKTAEDNTKINLRLIFKCVLADAELRLTSLAVPIVGNVNILRYLALVYPTVIPHDGDDYYIDNLLDICHVLERTTEKNKEAVVNKLFVKRQEWVYGNEFSIVDLAAYNVIKQWKNTPKYVPKAWFDKCEKLCA